LSEIGNRLRPEWLDGVLHQLQRSRSWLELRMPHYGDATLAALVRGFPAVAGVEHEPTETLPQFAQVRSGARLIGSGEGGLSCINCHDCLGERSMGDLRGPDLAGAHERLRGDWIRRWLREPSRIAPGTAMPAFFTALPATDREQKIGDIFAALSAGRNMPVPIGLRETTADYLLTVTNTPVVVRGFLPDSSPRSIAVGLPGGLSYCFDAESCRVRYAWSGEFLNMKPVWWGRGGQPPEPRGLKFYSAPDVFPLRLGDRSATPSVKFLGYALANKLPEFRFAVDGVAVKERIDAAPEGGLWCRFDSGDSRKDVWCHLSVGVRLRVAGRDVVADADGWARIPAATSTSFELWIPGPARAGPADTAVNKSTRR
jgi:mono/diheme cytochrome c family protein